MLRHRLLFGKVFRTDGVTPWTNCNISFKRNCNYTDEYQLPSDVQRVKTDSNGEFVTRLWCNIDGENESSYTCEIPGCTSFTFNLPFGDGTPLNISILRAGSSSPSDPKNETILEYIDEQIVSVSLNNTKLFSEEKQATSNLSALKAIDLTTKTYPVISDTPLYLGLVMNAVLQGSFFKALLEGEIYDSSWNWAPNTLVFLGNNGTLTQTLPQSNCLIVAGKAIDTDRMYIKFSNPLLF